MIDLVKLTIKAGDGGYGRVSFRREKYVPKGGPDGGNGASGGNVIVRGSASYSTLDHFTGVQKIEAEAGQPGGKRRKFGAKGDDAMIEVPVGTLIWLKAENSASALRRRKAGIKYLLDRSHVKFERYAVEKEGQLIGERQPDELVEVENQSDDQDFPDSSRGLKLFEITEVGQEIVLCQGGFGGRGNEAFKGPANTTPMEAEYGTRGEVKEVEFELRLLADLGLVGFPNAGKSTLISVLTKARPKIANYPFTTLEPHLGVMSLEGQGQGQKQELVIADIPGLIEGASQGKGLGHEFLKHIEHCQALLYVLALDEQELFNAELTDQQKAEHLWQQFSKLKRELKDYHQDLVEKSFLVSLNKLDLYSEKLVEEVRRLFKKHGFDLLVFSAATHQGLEELKRELVRFV